MRNGNHEELELSRIVQDSEVWHRVAFLLALASLGAVTLNCPGQMVEVDLVLAAKRTSKMTLRESNGGEVVQRRAAGTVPGVERAVDARALGETSGN